MDDVIVRLDVYCGDTFNEEHTKKADQEGEKIISKLKKASTELGLSYRASMYQLTDKSRLLDPLHPQASPVVLSAVRISDTELFEYFNTVFVDNVILFAGEGDEVDCFCSRCSWFSIYLVNCTINYWKHGRFYYKTPRV